MAKTKKERDIEILEHKVAKADELIANFTKFGISQKKIDAMSDKKIKHADDLDKVKKS